MTTQTTPVSKQELSVSDSFGWGAALTIVSGLLMLTALFLALMWAPEASNLGTDAERAAQRIFYFHVSSAWLGFLAFIVAAAASALYLITRRQRWDMWALASVEIGLAFFTMMIISGSIWAKPTWNVWWTWDPRLIISTICLLLYVGYLMLRGAIDNPERRARFAAVYALIAAISVPINWMAIRWWRTIHPAVIAPGNNAEESVGGFGLSQNIQITLYFCVFAFTIFYITLMYHRIKLEAMQRRVEMLKQQIFYQ